MNNIVYDYFKNASTKSAFPQAFLIGNVNFDAFKEQLESILENFFFNTKLDIYNNPDIFILRQNETLITKNNVKELLLNLSLTSQFSNLKIYIIEDCEKLTDKLIFRHPHVYHSSQVGAVEPKPLPYGSDEKTDEEVSTAAQVIEKWEQIKLKEKDGNKRVLGGVPNALPSLIKAYRIQDKARNVGFDWEDKGDVWAKVREELGELETELRKGDKDKSTKELGDFLFSVINAARLYKLNPDNALEFTNKKFISRFNYIEDHSIKCGKPLTDMTLEEMDYLWNEAKAQEQQ